jgi:hypothetical protein
LLVTLAGAAIIGSSCTHSSPGPTRSPNPGTITGDLPLCYGPGPNSNLWAHATIAVYKSGRLIETRTFPSSTERRRYSLILPAGTYELRMPRRQYSLKVDVRPDEQTSADWPQPVCI